MPDYRRRKRKNTFETKNASNDSVDVSFTFEGDFKIAKEVSGNDMPEKEESDKLVSLPGDIQMNGNKYGSVTRATILKRLYSNKGEWVDAPECGADIESFIGMNLTIENLNIMREAIVQALTFDGFIAGKNLNVEVMPIDSSNVKIVILARNVYSPEFQVITLDFSIEENRFTNFT